MLKVCASGGAAMPGEVLRGFEEAFDCKVLEGYGLSETSPVASFNHPDKERKVGSIGTPIEGVEMKVVDDDGNEVDQGEVGEIVIKGHNVMKGYWDRDDATKESIKDGWFYTGDMAKVDEDGYFFIVDRKKELIIRGGYNVYPREIEEVLYEHPAVLEAAVIGVQDDNMGEEVGAAVVLKDGEDVSEDELKGYVKEQVANYKYPRKVWFVDELPKGPDGQDPQARDRGAARSEVEFVIDCHTPPLLSGGVSAVFLIGGEHGGDHHRQHRHVGRSHLRLLHGVGQRHRRDPVRQPLRRSAGSAGLVERLGSRRPRADERLEPREPASAQRRRRGLRQRAAPASGPCRRAWRRAARRRLWDTSCSAVSRPGRPTAQPALAERPEAGQLVQPRAAHERQGAVGQRLHARPPRP